MVFPLLLALVLLAAVSSAQDEPLGYRLPLEVVPHSYDVKLVPYLDEVSTENQFTFDGVVSILVEAQGSNSTITLHAKEITILDLAVTDEMSGAVIQVSGTTKDEERDFLIVQLDTSLTPANMYRLNFSYKGILNSDLDGFYRSSYLVNGTTRWLAVTQFEATGARRAFPCFDEPALKANFTISICRLPEMTSLSNMPLRETTGPDSTYDGRYWDLFETSVKMSTYTVAFVVSEFPSLHAGNYSVWAQPNLIASGEFALQYSPALLSTLGGLLGIPYTLPKMDEVAVPDFAAGAMENWGLVTYQEGSLLVTSPGDEAKIATTIAHEFAHQWFGNLVTLSWWKYTWLNEAFASFFGTAAPNKVFTQWNMWFSQFQIMVTDSDISSRPLTKDVETPYDIMTMFDSITYEKGGSVLKMIQHAFGNQTFLNGLHYYLEARAFSSAVPDDLSAGLQRAVDEDSRLPEGLTVKTVMDSWTEQAGYPVLTVTRNYSEGTAEMSQVRFLIEAAQPTPDTQWYVPVSYTTSNNPDFLNTLPDVWLTPNQNKTLEGLPGDDSWILLNKQATGYFRINYDKQNWKLLQDQLNSSDFAKIHVLNRVQIQKDATALAEAGLLDVDTALEIMSCLEREVDPVVWRSVLDDLGRMYNKLVGSRYLEKLKAFYLRLMARFYQTVGFSGRTTENVQVSLVRPKLLSWLCLLGHEECVRQAASMRTAALHDSTHHQVRSSLLCSAARRHGDESWSWLWSLYTTTDNVKERQDVLRALGCAADTKLINRLFQLTVDENSGLRPEDRARVFSAACSGEVVAHCDTTLKFLASRLHQLADIFGEYESIATILVRVASKLRTREQVDYVSNSTEHHPFIRFNLLRYIVSKNQQHLQSVRDITYSAVKMAEQNVEWLHKDGAGIVSWLSRHA